MKKLLSMVLALAMVLGLCVTTWAEPVTYMKWDDTEKKLVEKQLTEGITPKSVATENGNVTWDGTTTEKWYIVGGDVTISGTLTVKGTVHLIIKDGCKLTVEENIKIDGDLTIYGQANKTGELIAGRESSTGSGSVYAIRVLGSLTVNGIKVTASAGNAGSGGSSYGINAQEKTVTFNDCAVTAIAGKGKYSNGIIASSLTVNGGTVNATGGEASDSSSGIYVSPTFTIDGGKVTATGGKVTAENTGYGSYGIGGGNATLTSGTLIAKGDTASTNRDKVKAMNSAPTLPTITYWWRTAETGDFTKFADDATAYVNGTNTYAEITTVNPVVTPPADEPAPAPEPEPEPDQEPAAPGHTPIRRQHVTTAVEDTTPDTGTTKTDDAKSDAVTSAQTFDAGVAVYGAMAVLSLTGTAWVARKKF